MKDLYKDLRPVIVVGVPQPEAIEATLLMITDGFPVHLCSSFPASSSSITDDDRSMSPAKGAAVQSELPLPGASCGLEFEPHHAFTIGAYVQLSTSPKTIYALTVPLDLGLNHSKIKAVKNATVTQPSPADRDNLYEQENETFKEILRRDIHQRDSLKVRRKKDEGTFEFAQYFASSRDLVADDWQNVYLGKIFDCETKRYLTVQREKEARPSHEWAILKITRKTAVDTITDIRKRNSKPWFPKFGGSKTLETQPLSPSLIVSKRGRSTGCTSGIVNGVKSIYRLPRDGHGIRRFDYAVLGFNNEPFGKCGDAGAIVYAHSPDNIDVLGNPKGLGKPSGIILGASVGGFATFVQDIDTVISGVKKAGHGDLNLFHN